MATQVVEDEAAPPPASSNAVLVVKPGGTASNLPLIEGASMYPARPVTMWYCGCSPAHLQHIGANVVGRQPVLGQRERPLIVADPTVSARHAVIGSPSS